MSIVALVDAMNSDVLETIKRPKQMDNDTFATVFNIIQAAGKATTTFTH
jgi:hypothetical protein